MGAQPIRPLIWNGIKGMCLECSFTAGGPGTSFNEGIKIKTTSGAQRFGSELSGTWCAGAVIQRRRTAWLIAISDFVIPCILQVIQVGVVFHGPTTGQSEEAWFNECSIMMIVNGYVIIVGVVFATVWAGATNWAMDEGAYWAKIPATPMSARTPSSATFSKKLENLSEEGAEY